jgi:hypothetical protein
MPVQAPPNPNTTSPNNPGNTPNTAPSPNQAKLETIRVVLASLDNNLDAFAREGTMSDLANERKQGPIFKRVMRTMWHTMMRERVVTKRNEDNRAEIKDSGNLRHKQGASDAQWREDVVRRYSSEYAEHVIHEEAGETYKKFDKAEAEADPGIKLMREEALDAICDYARGDIATLDDLNLVVERLEEGWRASEDTSKHIGEGIFMAHNIVAMGVQTKAALDARQGLSDIDKDALLDQAREDAEFITGEAKVGARSEIDPTRSERLAEKLRGKRVFSEGKLSAVGSVLGNEAVMSTMMSVGVLALQRGAASALTKLVPGLGASILVAIRERRSLLDERGLMERRRGVGEEADTTIKAQAELDATLYESCPVEVLLKQLSDLYDTNGDLIIRDRSDLEAAIELQGEIRARIKISDSTKKDLINFAGNSADDLESRRFDLDLAMAKLEVDMKNVFADPLAATAAGVQPGESFEAMAATMQKTIEGTLKIEMKKRDRLFNKLVMKQALKRAVVAGLTGAGLGMLLQYGIDALREFFGDEKSEVEMTLAGDEKTIPNNGNGLPETVGGDPAELPPIIQGDPADLPPLIGGDPTKIPPVIQGDPSQLPPVIEGGPVDVPDVIEGAPPEVPSYISTEQFEGGETVTLGGKTKIVLPEGYKAEVQGDTVKITTPAGEVFTPTLDKDGKLGKVGLDILKDKGFNIIPREDVVEGEPKIHKEKVTANEFVERHKKDMVKIKHEKWLINQSGGPDQKVFNLNELGLHNKQLDNGNILISVKGMTAEGSFYGDSSVNWKEAAKQGHLKLYLSASPGTQSRAFEIPIDADGEIVIDKNSPAGRLFNKDGEFIGGFQQVSVRGDVGPDGRVKIATLATVVGTKRPEITDIVETPTKTTAHTYVVVPPTENASYVEAEDGFFIPYVTVTGRRRLGRGIPQPANVAPAAGYPNTPPTNGPTPNGGPSPQNGGPNIPPAPGPNTPPQNGPNTTPNNGNPNTPPTSGPNAQPQGGPNTANPNPNTATNPGPNSSNNGPNSQTTPKSKPGPKPGPQPNPNTSAGPNGGPNASTSKPKPGPQSKPKPKPGPQPKPKPGPGPTPNDPNNKNKGPTYNLTDEDRNTLARMQQDHRIMPDMFKSLDLDTSQINGIAMKLIVLTLHELINASDRQPNEGHAEWRVRVVRAAYAYSERALSQLGTVSPGLRPFVQEAFENLRRATTPATTPTGGAGTNTTAGSSSAP